MLNNKFCLLIADDEYKMAKALKDYFTSNGYIVYTALDGEDALETFYAHNNVIDLVLLDIMMPKLNGYEVLAELRRDNEMVPVIMVTAKSQEYDELKGLTAGADDYITKPFSLSLLTARVENLLKRIYKNNEDFIVVKDLKISSTQRSVFYKGKEISLKRREFELISFLAVNKNQAFTREQLLNNVWGYNFEGDARTVDTHVKQLRLKFEDYDIIRTVHGVGYKLED